MLVSVKGTYENGRFVLDEPLPTSHAKIVVTIIEEMQPVNKRRKAGELKGKIWMSEDFDKPLHELLAS